MQVHHRRQQKTAEAQQETSKVEHNKKLLKPTRNKTNNRTSSKSIFLCSA
jgi:hypothetical protein